MILLNEVAVELVEAAPDAIIGVGPDGLILIANAQAEALFGYTRDELIGASVDALVPDAHRTRHPAHRGRYFADPSPRPMGAGVPLTARRKDGSHFPAEISLSSIATARGPMVSAAVRDVTERLEADAERERLKAMAERERMEVRLQQSQRLESLGQLAGGVAHDFNNLLAVIVNYTEFVRQVIDQAREREPDEPWAEAASDLAQVIRAGNRATELTHQLLAFARREVVRPQVMDLNTVIFEVEQLLRRTLGEHVDLRTRLSPLLWPVLADPGQIEQVLINLAVNARDAMPDGGTLTVSTSGLDLGPESDACALAGLDLALAPGRYVRLDIADSGTGIPADVLARVFEPFFTTKPKGKGTGLGLATVYGIVTQAGGHATITSAPGRGTTFTALLPASDDVPARQMPPPAPQDCRGDETILIVEDEIALRDLTCRMLTRNGYRVHAAADGLEAVRIAQTLPAGEIDLLLTDVVMPHMPGPDLARHLKMTLTGLRVIFMSGYAEPFVGKEKSLPADVTLVTKPFTESDLLATVRRVLDAQAAGHHR